MDASGVTKDSVWAWLDAQIERFGETLPVAPIPAEAHERIDPVAEAIAMMGGDDRRVIVLPPQQGRSE